MSYVIKFPRFDRMVQYVQGVYVTSCILFHWDEPLGGLRYFLGRRYEVNHNTHAQMLGLRSKV